MTDLRLNVCSSKVESARAAAPPTPAPETLWLCHPDVRLSVRLNARFPFSTSSACHSLAASLPMENNDCLVIDPIVCRHSDLPAGARFAIALELKAMSRAECGMSASADIGINTTSAEDVVSSP